MTTDSPGDTDHELLRRLEQVATTLFGGHFTIMRFGSNWRVGFTTPNDRHDITEMADGRTFAEAAHKALQRIRDAVRADIAKRRADVEAQFMAQVDEMDRRDMAKFLQTERGEKGSHRAKPATAASPPPA
jgi:hypothetical protein